MASDVQEQGTQPPNVTTLVGGIVTDAQQLMTQQLALFRNEIKQDLNRSFQAGVVMGLGLTIALMGGVVLVLSLAYLLAWIWPDMALWVAHLIVGVAVLGVGGVLFSVGKAKFDSFNPMPDKSIQAMQENVQWLTNTRT